MQQDKRVIKTQRAIREAFVTLLKRKGISRITVNDICEEALISRNTFYSHFADKYLLMETMSKEFVHELLEQVVAGNMLNNYATAISTTAWMFFDYLNENRDVVRLLSRNDPQFWQTFNRDLQEFVLAIAGKEEKTRVYVIYMSNALTGCYREYFEGRISLKPAEFVQSLIEISSRTNEFMNTSGEFT